MELKNMKLVTNTDTTLSLYKRFKRCKWLTVSLLFLTSFAVMTKTTTSRPKAKGCLVSTF